MKNARWFAALWLCASLIPVPARAQAFVARPDRILKIDPATGVQSTFFTPTPPERINDFIAFGDDALLAVLYTRTLSEEDEPICLSRIVSLNLSNAQATEVFLDDAERSQPLCITLGFDDYLYAGASGDIFQIDLEDGSALQLNSEPIDEFFWGIIAEPGGTLLVGNLDYILRFDPVTGETEYPDDYLEEVTWVNCLLSLPDGALYLAADNEKLLEILPSGDQRVVTSGGYLGVDEFGFETINSAIVGLAQLNSTQLLATVQQQFDVGWSYYPSSESRLIWIDTITGEQNLVSEDGWLDRTDSAPSFSGLVLMGHSSPRTAAPRLEMTHYFAPEVVRQLIWSAPGYMLQSSTNLSDTNGWANVPAAPVAYAGEARYTLSFTNAQQFYRLAKTP